jgi:hypothetical protein
VAKKWWQKHGAAKSAPQLREIREGRSETNSKTPEALKGRKPQQTALEISSQLCEQFGLLQCRLPRYGSAGALALTRT